MRCETKNPWLRIEILEYWFQTKKKNKKNMWGKNNKQLGQNKSQKGFFTEGLFPIFMANLQKHL